MGLSPRETGGGSPDGDGGEGMCWICACICTHVSTYLGVVSVRARVRARAHTRACARTHSDDMEAVPAERVVNRRPQQEL